jgi:hypothetical protein
MLLLSPISEENLLGRTFCSSTASCGLSTGCTIYVPAEAVDDYKDNTQWAKYANQIQAIPE